MLNRKFEVRLRGGDVTSRGRGCRCDLGHVEIGRVGKQRLSLIEAKPLLAENIDAQRV